MFINSFCSITSAGILDQYADTTDLQPLHAAKVTATEPDYKDLIPAMQLRRMTKPIRIGVAATRLCMQSGQNTMPASIHVGTAYGMLEDSENFLKKMIEQEEQMLNPTAFIQSTHNTVSGQIALAIGCMAHNMTFVHKAHSFESALLDASLLQEGTGTNDLILLGAVEELTNTSYEILKRFGVYNDGSDITGEGATFFGLSTNRQAESMAAIKAFDLFEAADTAALETNINRFTESHKAAPDDLFIKTTERKINNTLFCDAEYYQQYSGKYATMSAFGLAYACLRLKGSDKTCCWLLNEYGNHYSIMLIARPDDL